MKILVLVEDLRVNKSSAGIRNSNILKTLLEKRHELKCIYDYSDSKDLPWLKSALFSYERIKVIEDTIWIKILRKLPKSNAFSSYLRGFNFNDYKKINSWKKAIKDELNKNITYDFILVLGAGNSNLNFFAISEIKTSIPYIVNYHDPYPIHQYPEPYAKVADFVGEIRVRKSNKVMKKAYKVSFPSLRLYQWMLQFHPVLKNKYFIVPHIYTKLKNLPNSVQDTNIDLDVSKFNILHIGSLLGPRNPKYLLKAFAKFVEEDQERMDNVVLNIIGSVTKENKNFDKEITSKSVRVIKDRISYKKSIELMYKTNVLLILEAVAEDSPFMPGKLADYIAVKKTILALTPLNSETSRLLGKSYPFKTEMDNQEIIYRLLVKLWKNWKSNNNNESIDENLLEYISPENFNKILIKETKHII